MEFQQGMTLVTAAASALVGAGLSGIGTFLAMKTKVEKHGEDIKNIFENAIFTKQCSNCKENWQGQVGGIREEIRALRTEFNNGIDRIIDMMRDKP